MPYKIRTQRKKEIDLLEIQSKTEAFMEEMMARPLLIWGGIAILVLLGAGFYTMQYMGRQAEETAWILESEASKLFHEPAPLPQPIEEGEEEEETTEILDEQERLNRSAELYEEVLQKHSGTKAATVALFESANVYYKLENYEKAEAGYLDFLKNHSDHKSLVELVHLRLAYLYAKKGDSSSAKSHFQTVYGLANASTRDQAGFELARTLESDGQADEAKALYEKVSEEYSESPWGVEAKVRLTLLNPPEKEEEGATKTITSPELPGEAPKDEAPSTTDEAQKTGGKSSKTDESP